MEATKGCAILSALFPCTSKSSLQLGNQCREGGPSLKRLSSKVTYYLHSCTADDNITWLYQEENRNAGQPYIQEEEMALGNN